MAILCCLTSLQQVVPHLLRLALRRGRCSSSSSSISNTICSISKSSSSFNYRWDGRGWIGTSNSSGGSFNYRWDGRGWIGRSSSSGGTSSCNYI